LTIAGALPVAAQEMEARSYSASPIDTNFALGVFSTSSGDVSLDPSLPLTDVHAAVNTTTLEFSHTFPFANHTASWAVVLPYLDGQITGNVYGQGQSTTRDGFPDFRARLAINLLGGALTPAQFARRKPRTSLGVSVTISAPTGTYDPTQLINIGSNRWSFKPEVGVEQPMGKWFADLSAAWQIFGKNTDYFGENVLEQAPLASYQVHTGYNFRPGQWLAADWTYYTGGATTVGEAQPINRLSNSRYGLTFSQPFGPGFSVKLAWSHWLSGQYGQNFSTAALTLQYRWFNRH
jgi:Putative MetA-pathway of phenol degradation